MGPFLYIDAGSGASGDMFLGALVDLGYPLPRLRAAVKSLGVPGIRLGRSKVRRAGIACTHVRVTTSGRQPHRGRKEIRKILRGAAIDPAPRRMALEVFDRIIESEARLHGIPVERVHLHEVGALDALADVVGTVCAVHELGFDDIVASPVNVGSGTVRCAHGEMPVPAPATADLLKGVPIHAAGDGEKTTPTGAALLRVLATEFGPLPPALIARIGQGAGTRDDPGRPNMLRLLAGRRATAVPPPDASLVEVKTQIDDLDARIYGHLLQRLHDGGALEVSYTPVQTKKGRPAVVVTALASREAAAGLGTILFDETTTLGYRVVPVERHERPRRLESVATPYGPVQVKIAAGDGAEPLATPEYEDCRLLAEKHGVPLRRVLDAAREAWSSAGSGPRRKK